MAQLKRAFTNGIPFRWWIVALLFLATTVNYVDRQVIGILKNTITADLHWDPKHAEEYYSYIQMAFLSLYAAGYLLGGRLTDVIGIRLGYTLYVAVWSLAAAATGFARSLAGFSVARAVLGLAEGGNFPTAVKTVGEWFPKKERALATGIFNAGSNMGPIVGPLIVIGLATRFGWPVAFCVTGLGGLLWIVLWLAIYKAPTENSKVSADELAYIQSDPPDPSSKVSWLRLAGYKSAWAFIVGMALSAPFWWFYLFWAPDFFQKTFHMDLSHVGLPLVAIYLLADIGSVAGGWLSSWLIHRGKSVAYGRKFALLIAACCVIPVVFAPQSTGPWIAITVVGLAMAGHQAFSANLYTLVSDTMPRYAISSVVGMGGMAGSLVGIFFFWKVGKILQATHSYQVMFVAAPFAYFLALGIIHLLLPKFEQANIESH